MTAMLAWLLPTVFAIVFLLLATVKKPFVAMRLGAELAAGLFVAGLPFLLASAMPVGLVIYFGMLQMVGLLLAARLLFGRLQTEFVAPSTQLNCWGVSLLLLLGLTFWAVQAISPSISGWLLDASLLAAALTHLGFLAQFLWARGRFTLKRSPALRPLNELPTVSVCIPARNEDDSLAACLTAVLASDYPKLEVLVLDDCSQDKTSAIIKSFAHNGVRFIQGAVPATGWLGKNQARQTLAEHASGDYLLFIDVDTRVAPQSMTHLIDYVLDTGIAMVTVLPQNQLGSGSGILLDSLRFYWEQVLLITRRHVPVASQAWIINTAAFKGLGGFKSVAQKIVPEASFAQRLAVKDAYRFITSTAEHGITNAKKWPGIVNSAIRLLYPRYKRQPLFALAAIGAVIALLVLPGITTVIYGLTGRITATFWLAAAAWTIASITYTLIKSRTDPRSWPVMVLLLPVTAVQEVVLILISLLKYEFGQVNWRGRNICYPVTLSAQNQPGRTALPVRR